MGNSQGNQNNQQQQQQQQQSNPADLAQQQNEANNHWSKIQQQAQEKIEEEDKQQPEQQQESNSQQIKKDFQTQKFELAEKQIVLEQEFKQELKVKDQEYIMDQQFQDNANKEQQAQQEEAVEYTPEQVESIWLSRTFKIFVDSQEMNEKQVDFIIKGSSLTIDYLINEVFYQFLVSKLYSEEEKLNFLLDVLQSLSSVGIHENNVIVAEGNIPLIKFEKLLSHIEENLITCILYPEGLEWQQFDENPNNFNDKRNIRADTFYNSVFCSQYLTLSQNMLVNFLEYLENKCSLDDAHKLLDLMLKRELYLNANLSISNNDQQIKSLQLLQTISEYPKITETLLLDSWGFGKFSLIQTGKQFQVTSLIGKILSLSGFFTDGQSWQQYFANDQQQMLVQMNSLRNRITATNEKVCELFTSIIKKNKLRHKFFEFLSKIIYLNLNLEKSFNQALQTQCSTPGMMFNFQYILMKIFNPWIQDGEKIKNAIQKIDKTMLSYIKKHPYFAQIYQNIDFLHPEATPFVEPEEFSTKVDTMTVIFLLTQRVNHIVAATLDQYYYNLVLKMLSQNAQQFGQQSPEVLKIIKYKISLDAQVLCPKSIQCTMDFLGFSSKLALSLLDEHNKPIYPFGLLASSFVTDIHSFFAIYSYNDQALNHDQQLQRCCEFAIVAMNTRNIANPHLRIKGIELFHIFDENRYQKKKNYKKQQVADIFRNNQIVSTHIIGGLLKVFIDSERTGEGNQFYEKFSFRYQFCKLIRYLLEQHKDIYKEELTIEVQQQKDEFLNFANFYLSDMIYLLDESLSRMKEMKDLEADLNPENTVKHNKIKEQLKTYTLFLKEYYQNIQVFSEVQPDAFLTDEIRDKLVNNLNYTLEQLNGKNALQYKIQSFDSVNFDPKFIMGCVIELYLNFSSDEKFLLQVVKDERCFSIELFERTINLLDKHRIIPDQRIFLFKDLIVNLKKQLENYQSLQVQDVPPDFLDPLCYSIMTDPVKLPHSNVIVDRLTIKKQLLNQQIDPFDRSPLTIDMVIEQPELKQKIAKYLEEVKRNKQKLIQQE